MALGVDRSFVAHIKLSNPHTIAIDSAITDFMAIFYSGVATAEGPLRVLGYLSPEETQDVNVTLRDFLWHLFDPRVGDQDLVKYAIGVGFALGMVGVRASWVVETHPYFARCFHKILHLADLPKPESDRLMTTMRDRLSICVVAILAEEERIDEQLSEGIERVNFAVGTSNTSADLIRSTLSALHSIEGVASVSFGRADSNGTILYEYFEGQGFGKYLELLESGLAAPMVIDSDDEAGQGPSGRAWRSGAIQFCDSFAVDSSLAPWLATAAVVGFRSILVLPVTNADGESVGLLNVYSPWPGFFTVQKRYRAFAYLQQVLSSTLVKLDAGNVISHQKRNQFRSMIRSDSLVMLYQPIVDLRTGSIAKLECLARLRNDQDELVSPLEFMAALGSEDLFVLFERGLTFGLEALETWEHNGFVTGISVNLPTQGVGDSRYLETVKRELARTGIDPRRLTLELTEEKDLAEAAFDSVSLLVGLRSLGVLVAQDDLGSGYSSLVRLERFGFHEVKIDQELVRAVGDPKNALDLIQHLTRLSHDLGIEVVVEGLESAALIEAAAIMGADYGQGYGIARPLEADQVVSWFENFSWNVNFATPRTALGALAALRRWSRQVLALGDYSELIGSSLPLSELKGYLRRFPELGLDDRLGNFAQASPEERTLSLLAIEDELASYLNTQEHSRDIDSQHAEPLRVDALGTYPFCREKDSLGEVPFTGVQLREILALQNGIVRSMSTGTKLDDLLSEVCLAAEAMLVNSVATVMTLGSDGALYLASGPSLTEAAKAKLGKLKPGPNSGSCGAAVFHHEPVFVGNTQIDSRWRDLRETVNEFGLRACWSFPVFDPKGEILGTFALTSFENRMPSSFHRLLMETCANLVSIILDRDQVNKELELRSERLSHMFDGNQAMKFIFDADSGEIIDFNTAISSFYGYSDQELCQMTLFDLNPSMSPQMLIDLADRVALEGSYQGTAVHRLKSGEERSLEYYTHLYVERGKRLFMSIFHDVTERLVVEQQLARERNLSAAILNELSGMVVVLGENGIVTHFNRAAELITGCTLSQLSQDPTLWHQWIDPSVHDSVSQAFRDLLSGRAVGPLEIWHTNRNGERRLIGMRDTKVVSENGDIEAVVLLGTDTTEAHRANELVQAQRDFYSNVMDAIPQVIMVLDRRARIVSCNRALNDLLGIDENEVIGQPSAVADLFSASGQIGARAWFMDAIAGNVKETSIAAIYDRHKNRRIFEWKCTPLAGPKGPQSYFVITAADITQRRHDQHQLEKAALVFEHSSQAIVMLGAKGQILDVNPAFCQITGYSRVEALGLDANALADELNGEGFLSRLAEVLEKESSWSGTIWKRRKDNTMFPAFTHLSVLRVPGQREIQVLSIFSDISDIVTYQEELADLAYHDGLTKLPNRSLLAEKIHGAMARARRTNGVLGLVYLDLDNFKPINDTYGHSCGDRLLVQLATRIKEALREVDTVARIGGDEFVCVIDGLENVEACSAILQRLVQAIKEPIELGERGDLVWVTASMGVLFYSDGESDPDTLLRRADQLMYEAKRAGGNQYVVEAI